MDSDNKGVSKKIKFRSISTTTEPLLGFASKIEDINSRQRSQSEQKYKTKGKNDIGEEESTPSLLKFLGVELTRGYILEHDEEQYSARREKVYSFARIPTETEKFMAYGFFQCADSYLFVYTFLPVRFLLAIWALITRPIRNCFGFGKHSKSLLKPAEICDLLKVAIIFLSTAMMFVIDTSMMYHLIKSQSVIKLYIFYNMLEVGDRLFSAFGQDLIDALFWTATEPRGRKRDHVGILPHFSFVVAYVFSHSVLVLCQATTLNVAINSSSKALLTIMISDNFPLSCLIPQLWPVSHSVLVLCQATTLNVAINSSSKALLTIMISNNFVELKGSVFKKFDKNNLFQVACSDVRERFHLFVLLFIVVLQTMKEYSWKEETLWVLVPDCVIVLFAEMLVDWVKHAFITRFNELPFIIYRDYTLSLAYDMAQTRQKNAFTDHSDLVARRMGFIPLPLTVVMLRVLGHTVKIEGAAAISLTVLAFLCVTSFKILNSVTLLGIACDLINHHQQDHQPPTDAMSTPVRSIKDSATSPTRPHTPVPLGAAGTVPGPGLRRSLTMADPGNPSHTPLPPPPTLNSTPLFTNSAVSIKDICLNEEMLRVGESGLESIGEESLTRSVPNIQQATEQPSDPDTQDSSPCPSPVKRAESEPSLPHAVEAEGEAQD